MTCGRVLITGGAGYIGTHVAVVLANAGYTVVIADNFSNSSKIACERVREICTGCAPIDVHEVDVRDTPALRKLFAEYNGADGDGWGGGGRERHVKETEGNRKEAEGDGQAVEPICAVIHLAGVKSLAESMVDPLKYYENNVGGTLSLLRVMREFRVTNLLFSSTAMVYGETNDPASEATPIHTPCNPYGNTKMILERILNEVCEAHEEWRVIILRYFNPIGAHPSGEIGDVPVGEPNNLMPFISQVLSGKRECLHVFGDDFDTPDGTGMRDYFHVMDLSNAHEKAMARLLMARSECRELHSRSGLEVFNLGAGRPFSVLQLVHAMEKATGLKVPLKVVGRRVGDVAVVYSDSKKAQRVLGWKAEKTLDEMCEDVWRFLQKNPNGYE